MYIFGCAWLCTYVHMCAIVDSMSGVYVWDRYTTVCTKYVCTKDVCMLFHLSGYGCQRGRDRSISELCMLL